MPNIDYGEEYDNWTRVEIGNYICFDNVDWNAFGNCSIYGNVILFEDASDAIMFQLKLQ